MRRLCRPFSAPTDRRVTWINIQQHPIAYALWHERTQEPRILAQLCSENAQHGRHVSDLETKATMLRIAENYDF